MVRRNESTTRLRVRGVVDVAAEGPGRDPVIRRELERDIARAFEGRLGRVLRVACRVYQLERGARCTLAIYFDDHGMVLVARDGAQLGSAVERTLEAAVIAVDRILVRDGDAVRRAANG